MKRNSFLLGSGTLALSLLVACGGGGGGDTTPPSNAGASLSYTDPTTGSWQLKKNTGLSTSTHLVLDLVATSAGSGSGVAIHLSADATKATWARVQTGDPEYVRNGDLFALGSGTTAFKSKVATGTLQFAVSQKGTTSPAPVPLNGVVARIALDMASGAQKGTATLGPVTAKTKVLQSDGNITDIAVMAGTLTVQ